MICENCGKDNKGNNKFCVQCGNPLKNTDNSQNTANKSVQSASNTQNDSVKSASTANAVYCTNCGYTNTNGSRFCNSCGAPMGQNQIHNNNQAQYIAQERIIIQNNRKSLVGLGIFALILGILSFIFSFIPSFMILQILGLIMAIVTCVCGANSHSGVGTAGIVFGVIALIICIAQLLAVAACGGIVCSGVNAIGNALR